MKLSSSIFLDAETVENLKELQRVVLGLIRSPLTARDRMRKKTAQGQSVLKLAQNIIKPTASMSSFERLEVYNQQYWFKILEAFREDFAGLYLLLGEKSFRKVVEYFLDKYPPHYPTLWNIGEKLDQFLKENPGLLGFHHDAAIDMVRLEKALFVAFDAPERPPISSKEIVEGSLENLQIDLQPHISLLELKFEVENFIASNSQKSYDNLSEKAITDRRKKLKEKRNQRISLNQRKHWIVVHRFRNIPYIKEIEYPAFCFLRALKEKHSLAEASESFISENQNEPDNTFLLKIGQWTQEFTLLGWFCLWKEKME